MPHSRRRYRAEHFTTPPAPIAPLDGAGWPPPEPEILTRLATAEITAHQLVPWGSNYTFAVTLELDGAEPITGIYKPRRGETPLWDFDAGTLYRREYASFLVSCLLGWNFIPPTVIRDGPYGIGTVQLYVEPESDVYERRVRRQYAADLRRIALFDLLTNNADRKASHCFVGRHDRRIWGIDHGLTFHVHPKLRTVLWDPCGEPIDAELVAGLDALAAAEATVRATLAPHLAPAEIDAFFHRLTALREHPVFPHLDPRRNIPYGW